MKAAPRAALILFSTVIIVLGFQTQVECAMAIEKHDPEKNCSKHCCSYELGAMNKGEIKRIEDVCQIAECLENRDIQFRSCFPVRVRYPCYKVKGDLSKPFPQCCYEFKC